MPPSCAIKPPELIRRDDAGPFGSPRNKVKARPHRRAHPVDLAGRDTVGTFTSDGMKQAAVDGSEFLYDPKSWAHLQDPHAAFDRMRDEGALHWSPILNEWVATSYAAVKEVLSNKSFNPLDMQASVDAAERSDVQPLSAAKLVLEATLFLARPPGHAAARRYLAQVLNSKPLAECAPMIERIVEKQISQLVAAGGGDLVSDFAKAIPYRFTAALLGVPESDLPFLVECGEGTLVAMFNRNCTAREYRLANARIASAIDYLQAQLAERRVRPRDDGMTRMVALADNGPAISERELAARCYFLFVAGVETTVSFFSSALSSLVDHPEETERWRRGDVGRETALEELLRFGSPVQMSVRCADEPLTLAGAEIKSGERVCAVIAAANHDPEVFADPHRLDLGRSGAPHLAFGDGGHSCLGAAFARLEGRIALAAWLAAGPWRPAGPRERLQLEFMQPLKTLPMVVGC